jgi:hypothetical protein
VARKPRRVGDNESPDIIFLLLWRGKFGRRQMFHELRSSSVVAISFCAKASLSRTVCGDRELGSPQSAYWIRGYAEITGSAR